ncbi:MAG: site-specific DNA-methyltransferase, partial [Armatimonadetes bacterium]|nr:site-specific DNA-methyltransferase [Armatimonadota bacterium]
PIFGGKSVFETPKPVGVISRLLQLTTDRSALILDSFAGSGTTAHAVLAANERDGGDRRFILVECEDYADTVTAERVRRVITGYPYKGTQREALLERKVTWTQVQKGSALADEARACAEMHREAYDEIKTEVKNGALTVTGIRNVAERAPGIGGSFTYCTLGVPMDEGKLLSGGSLPSWEALADYQFYTATGRSRPSDGPARIPGTLMEWYAGRADDYHVWVVYRPDLEYLRSREPTLTLNMARDIAGAFPGEPHLVCAPSRFVPNRMLLPLGVEFAPLPYSLYRIEKD